VEGRHVKMPAGSDHRQQRDRELLAGVVYIYGFSPWQPQRPMEKEGENRENREKTENVSNISCSRITVSI